MTDPSLTVVTRSVSNAIGGRHPRLTLLLVCAICVFSVNSYAQTATADIL